jgi:hypothetical protein
MMNDIKIQNKMLIIKATETPLRMWKRRLIVALTDDEKQKCKSMIKKYK